MRMLGCVQFLSFSYVWVGLIGCFLVGLLEWAIGRVLFSSELGVHTFLLVSR